MREALVSAGAQAQSESQKNAPHAINRPGLLESRKAQLVSAAAVFILSLALYGWTLAPAVTLVDSGELIAAAHEPGVAHPPGFPLYILLAHLATLIPIGSVAERVNFASALFASLAAAALTLTVHEALRARLRLRQAERKQKKKKDRGKKHRETVSYEALDQQPPNGPGPLIALAPGTIAGLMLATSRTHWAYATIAEVYALNTLLIIAVFYLMMRWRRERLESIRSDRSLYIAAFVFGLSLGVHHVTAGIMLPALAALAFSVGGKEIFKSKQLLRAGLASVAGLSIYVYLPLAASGSPLVNWGTPDTFERFWWHVTGRQYQDFFSFSLERVFGQLGQFITLVAREFGPWWLPLGLLLIIAGAYAVFRRDRRLFWFLALVVLFDLAYALNYEIAEDKDAYYLPAFVAMAIAAGAGVEWVIAHSRTLKLGSVMVAALLFLVPATALASSLPFNDRSRYFIAKDYVENILSTVEPNGMLLTLDWQVYSPLMYFRLVEMLRPDVVAIDVNHLRRSWYYDYLRRAYPDLIEKNRDKV
ncbi:MAG TPA: DUF2723 domain-containing protein, partial [Blastocatellia bacterium]|nr:DUF2723 domain-containing protein [Blastocatellia bacterium]